MDTRIKLFYPQKDYLIATLYILDHAHKLYSNNYQVEEQSELGKQGKKKQTIRELGKKHKKTYQHFGSCSAMARTFWSIQLRSLRVYVLSIGSESCTIINCLGLAHTGRYRYVLTIDSESVSHNHVNL